jgi:MoaA/NifB/PqqE/SkfB family radical SAM enzyme
MKRLSGTCNLTFRCNYTCPYCDQARDKIWLQYPDLPADAWIKFFSRLPPSLLHLTGGEPFLHRGFCDILSAMPKRHLFYIATNLSQPLDHFLSVVDRDRLLLVAASLHPSHRSFSLKTYLEKVQTLQAAGIPVYVNYVAYPEQIWMIPFLKKSVELVGAMFNVDPFISKTYRYSAEEELKVKKFLTQRRKTNFAWNEEGKLKYCSAGMDYFYVVPNGQVYRCLSGFYHHDPKRFYLFNITETPHFNIQPKPCSNACVATCDQNMVTLTDKTGRILAKPMYSNDLLLTITQKLLRHATTRRMWNSLSSKMVYIEKTRIIPQIS